MKTAVILFNLGGPLAEGDIEPFLYNFFMDRNIIAAPLPLRYLVAKFISKTRSKGPSRRAYGHLGFKSPLLENTQKQAAALEAALEGETKVFTCMRYWHPRSDEVAREVRAYNPGNIVLLPLYPQYSTATTRSAFQDWDRAAKAAGIEAPTRRICCWPALEGFVEASAGNIREEMQKAPPNLPFGTRLLFSAHGLPEKTIRAGDPYQSQCEKTAAAIAKHLGIPGLDWQVCYQSRLGPLKWTGPSIGEALEQAARDKKGVIVYPHSFVSEHVETLVELDIEYRQKAKDLGLPHFARAATAGTHPAFIAGLAALVKKYAESCECPAHPRQASGA